MFGLADGSRRKKKTKQNKVGRHVTYQLTTAVIGHRFRQGTVKICAAINFFDSIGILRRLHSHFTIKPSMEISPT